MDKQRQISELKHILLGDVAYLCRRVDRLWAEPIAKTFRDLRESKARAVFFGGTLRALLLARISGQTRIGRPRDIDIVVDGIDMSDLRNRFQSLILRETRFGGLKLNRLNMQFDVWPLAQTWFFHNDTSLHPAFCALPYTTFFNVEAIAVDVWASPGCERQVYSGDDQFFSGILSRTLEVNREENPFPALCVVRALAMAHSLQFCIGRRLAQYLADHGPRLSDKELEQTQKKHYGQTRIAPAIMRMWIDHIKFAVDHSDDATIGLPVTRQKKFWPELELDPGHESVHVAVLEKCLDDER